MTYRKMFLWLTLLIHLLMFVVYVLVLQGQGNSIDKAIGLLTGGALKALPITAASSVQSASDYALTYWFLALVTAYMLSILSACVLTLTEGKTSLVSRFLWLLSFVFPGFIAVPTYCIVKLRDKSAASAA
jgi:hypothetical protein